MLENFVSILKNPATGNSLNLDKNGLIDTETGEKFMFDNGVVHLIHKAEKKSSELHKEIGTEFDYHDHYEKDAVEFNYFRERDDKARKHEDRRVHETIIKSANNDAELILDVGCGRAWVAQYFSTRGKKVISMDISTTNPQKAVETYPSDNHLGLVGDAFKMPIKEDSIDTIIASEIMEHVPDPVVFVKSLFSCVKPGGKLLITTPYNEKLEFSLCIHCNKPTPKNAHIHSFNENNIQKLIPNNSGYKVKTFYNFYLAKLKLHPILALMTYPLWNAIDKTANLIFKRPNRLLIVLTK